LTKAVDGKADMHFFLLTRGCARYFFITEEGGWGDVFTVDLGAEARAVESVIWPFGGLDYNALQPTSAPVFGPNGNLYGSTQYGSINQSGIGSGVVYELTRNPDGTWSETALYGFSGGADGSEPVASPTVDSNGNVYGATWVGGTGDCTGDNGNGCGVVYEVSP
jgi:hypothetical protein